MTFMIADSGFVISTKKLLGVFSLLLETLVFEVALSPQVYIKSTSTIHHGRHRFPCCSWSHRH
jgi:hypothetical protein